MEDDRNSLFLSWEKELPRLFLGRVMGSALVGVVCPGASERQPAMLTGCPETA